MMRFTELFILSNGSKISKKKVKYLLTAGYSMTILTKRVPYYGKQNENICCENHVKMKNKNLARFLQFESPFSITFKLIQDVE